MAAWLQPLNTPADTSDVRLRLILFPHAGGSASAFRDWELPAEFEVFGVQPPGRGSRHAEPHCTSLEALVDGVIEALRPTLDTGMPFAFFGHSFGSIAAVEVANALSERGLASPAAVFVSAHPAPGTGLDASQANLSQLPTDEVRRPHPFLIFPRSPLHLPCVDAHASRSRSVHVPSKCGCHAFASMPCMRASPSWPLLPSSLCPIPARSHACLLYTSPSPRDRQKSRMPSSA